MHTAYIARFASFALAALVTGVLFGAVDSLAYEQHAAVEMARQAAEAGTRTAADGVICHKDDNA